MEVRFTMFSRYFVTHIDNWNSVVRLWHIIADVCSRTEISRQLHLETQWKPIRRNTAFSRRSSREAHCIQPQHRNTDDSP